MKRLLFAVLGAFANHALAQTAAEALFGSERSVSIATGRAHLYRTAPAVATVITAEDIRDGGFRSVVEALRLVPGVHLGWTNDYAPNVLVRGFSSFGSGNLLVLLDGVAQSDLILGNPLSVLGVIPIDAIDRIEVTRGPGSSVFGADAFSGVVNVITRQQVDQPQITLSGGSERTRDGRLLVGNRTESSDILLSAEVMETDGPTPLIRADHLTQIDAALGTDVSLAPRAVNTDQRNLGVLANARFGQTRAMLRLSRTTQGLGAGILSAIDPSGTRTLETVEGRLAREVRFSKRLALTLQLDAAQTRLALDDVTWFPASGLFAQGVRFDASAEQETARLRADLRYAATARHFITLGLGVAQIRYAVDALELSGLASIGSGMGVGTTLSDSFTGYASALTQLLSAAATGSAYDGHRRLLSAYLQDEWLIVPKWSLTWGARLDDDSDVGTQVSPRAVLVWTPLPEWTAKLLYGEGFRAPTLLETRNGLLPIYQANAELESERLRTVELALQYRPHHDFELGLNLFHHETLNQIRQQNRTLYAEPENVGRQIGQGGELDMRWALSRNLLLRGWYAYQYNTDETTGEDAGYSPHHRLYGSLQYRWGRTVFNLQGMYVGDRARVAEDTRNEAPEYGQLDLLIRHDLTKQLSVQLDIRNLLNGNLKEASAGTSLPQDLPLAVRTVYGSIEVRF
ncbi:TonB-dependent receptor [Thiorhodococcus drewsii AZ1]|uniref:TonB-dependent receptor n=1 Tax=Thiorhodococcus drewsii AZ1 TaxID=765913 RepID=G2E6P9_9GAMM|nr:TonB-dependent receptor [Thiorhodococcus drewsii]EGV28196.1 TonB-dependent receptor [Thiorhodococcus drewsii AZ1]